MGQKVGTELRNGACLAPAFIDDWCGNPVMLFEELGYLPVIIEQHRKGKLQVRAVLTRYEPTADTLAASL